MATGPRIAKFSPPKDVGDSKQHKQLLSQLKQDIADFRHQHWPPDTLYPELTQIQDLPIYHASAEQVAHYRALWQPFFDRAYAFYPDAHIGPESLPLPSTLGLPLFVDQVERLHLTRTHAKESKSFGAVGTLVDRCGDYQADEIAAMKDWMDQHPEGQLVAHRAFIDLRAYVFCQHPITAESLLPERVRFYRTGLVLSVLADFEQLDSRQKPRKQRSDAYQDPLGVNSTWTVFGRAGYALSDHESEPEYDQDSPPT